MILLLAMTLGAQVFLKKTFDRSYNTVFLLHMLHGTSQTENWHEQHSPYICPCRSRLNRCRNGSSGNGADGRGQWTRKTYSGMSSIASVSVPYYT